MVCLRRGEILRNVSDPIHHDGPFSFETSLYRILYWRHMQYMCDGRSDWDSSSYSKHSSSQTLIHASDFAYIVQRAGLDKRAISPPRPLATNGKSNLLHKLLLQFITRQWVF